MPAHIYCMAYSFLVFDFGVDEDAAQQARHRIEGWRQGFRLDKKLQLKFERKDLEAKQDTAAEPPAKASKGSSKGKAGSKTKVKTAAEAEAGSNPHPPSGIRLIVSLDFSKDERSAFKISSFRTLSAVRIIAPRPKPTAKAVTLQTIRTFVARRIIFHSPGCFLESTKLIFWQAPRGARTRVIRKAKLDTLTRFF